MADSEKYSRPATIDDLKSVLRALNENGVDYLLRALRSEREGK